MVVLDSAAKCLRYIEEECIWLEYDAIEVAFYCYVIRFFNEEKFSEFEDFSKTS